jgi:hypothetical protein
VFWAPFNRSATRMRRRVIFTRRSPRAPGGAAGAAGAAGVENGLAAAGGGGGFGVSGLLGAAFSGAFSAAFCIYHSESVTYITWRLYQTGIEAVMLTGNSTVQHYGISAIKSSAHEQH